ncbi:uncharacterized protein LOC108907224 isoform X2 [Anoplophora glabripennis]|uniref:uncharacterized protein LOC108907224 isoform X2 n=1 Tax=Anoplophora glabripennis TaxID=217634 RepID=UPI000873C7BD|nr:uncharacterized protein LOC108907224 isoform X2 [Anoplophora glabripennis]
MVGMSTFREPSAGEQSQNNLILGLIHRVHNKQKTEPTEKKTYKKTFEGPRQRPSDADTIQRMLANLPAKRSTRKLISLQDGIYRARKTTQNIKQNKVKCGKVIYKSSTRNETTEKTINTTPTISKSQINSSSSRRSLRNLNKVLVSRILDTNTTLNVKRKIKALNDRRRTRQSLLEQENIKEIINDENLEQILTNDSSSPSKTKSKVLKKDEIEPEGTQPSSKRSSPRSSPKNLKKMSVKKLLTGKINIKSFFPVKKKKNRKILTENQNPQDVENAEAENSDIKTRSKRKFKEPCEEKTEEKTNEVATVKIEQKKTKHETFSTLVRSFSLRKKKLAKKSIQNNATEISLNDVNNKQKNPTTENSEENKQIPSQTGQELDKSVKKRKLKSSFRSVINKVKKLKIENTPDNSVKTEDPKPNPKTPKDGAFLEGSSLEGPSVPVRVEKVITPSTSETKENTADISTTAPTAIDFHDSNENPPIPETIFKLELNNEKSLQAKGELDFDTQPVNTNVTKSSDCSIEKTTETESPCKENDTALQKTDKTQPISIETSVKPKVVPLISPNMKGKIRKPTRGLNDCIAMLTSKLQQKTVEENSNKVDSIFSLLSPTKAPVPFRESYPPKTECILRIPTFRSQTSYPEIEETALDLSTKSMRHKELAEEPFVKSLDTYINTTMVKINDVQPHGNFIIPTFDRKLKVFNSVDRIIEEVVENRIPAIVPQIQQRQWNSVDDIIQKVIDDQRSKIKLPIRNSVDDIIDFVVGSEKSTGNIINDIVNQDFILNKETTVRKIGSIRKSKNKKSSIVTPGETVTDSTPKVVTYVEKEPLKNITMTKLDSTDTESSFAKSNSLKKKNKPQKSINNIQHVESEGIILNTPIFLSILKATDVPEIADKNKTEESNNSCTVENSSQHAESLLNTVKTPEQIDLKLNDAFIDTSKEETIEKTSTAKVKKGNRKVGQIRNRSRVKVIETKVEEPQKKLLETNIDALLDVKEIKSSSELQYSSNLSASNENFLTKSDEMKQLPNEDEPHLLENKPMTLQQKPNVPASDSEDDIPLAALVKSDEKGANPTEVKIKLKTSSCDEVTVERQSNTDLANMNVKENKSEETNEAESKDEPNIGKLDADHYRMEEVEAVSIKEDLAVSVADNSIDKTKFIEKPDTKKNNNSDKSQIEETEMKINEKCDANKQNQINDIIGTNLSTITQVTELSDDRQGYVTDGKVFGVSQNTDSLTSTVDLREDKTSPESSLIKEKEILNSESVVVKETIKKSRALKKETKSVSQPLNDTIQTKLISTPDEQAKNVDLLESETEKSSKTKLTNDGDCSKITDFDENVKEDIKNITEIFKKEASQSVKKPKNRMNKNKFDVSNKSLSNNPLIDMINSKVIEELTVQLKPLTQSDQYSFNIPDLKRKSELNILLDTIPLEDSTEQELKPVLSRSDEISPKTKTKLVKSKAKLKAMKTMAHDNLKFPNDTMNSNIIVASCGKIEPEQSKQINTDEDQTLLIEDEIPLKKLYQNVCNSIAQSNKMSRESEDVDREIENILFSTKRTGSSKRKNVKDPLENTIAEKIDANDLICNKTIHAKCAEAEEKSNTKKSNEMKNILDTTTNINKSSTDDEALPIYPEMNVASKKSPKELKQPVMKNLEITLELTDVTKSVFSLSTNKNDVLSEKTIKIKKKRQSKSVNKKSAEVNDDNIVKNSSESDENVNEKPVECISNRTKTESDRLNRSRSRSIKNTSASDVTLLPEQTNTIDITFTSPTKDINGESIGNSVFNSKSKDFTEVEKDKDFSSTLEDSSNINKTDITLENAAPELRQLKDNSSQLMVKGKVKHNRHSTKTKTPKKPKAKCKIPQIDLELPKQIISNDVEKAPVVAIIDLLVDNTNLSTMDKETNKNFDPPIDPQIKENTSENTPDKVNEEPPIKIVINKQKTRRKSKSFKKIDLKGQNDLFKDFALVIKKPKRVTPIIAYTPADTFSKDIYPNYLKKPVEEPVPLPKVDTENEADENFAELDSSVEEMDMELDEIPFTSNIIERDTKSFLPPVTETFSNAEVEAFVETLTKLENDKLNIEEKNTRTENSIKDVAIEELFLPSEKDLTLPTEAEVEEFLYETNRKSTRNKDIDTESPNKKCKMDSDNKNKTLDNSYQNVQDLTKLDLISGDVDEKNEDAIVPTLVVPTVESDADKYADNTVDALIINCDTQSMEDEGKTNTKRSASKKKKSKNSKNMKVKAPFTNMEPENINAKPVFSPVEPSPALNSDVKEHKRKRCKSTTIDEIYPTANDELKDLGKNSNKLKDIDSIYAFSESEDFEIEKPIEKPKRPLRKQTKSLSESVNTTTDDLVIDNLLPSVYEATSKQCPKDLKPDGEYKETEITKSSSAKRRPRLCNFISEQNTVGEIKENDVNIEEESRKSVRSAKVKALEHIHDDALAELTESERNRDLEKDKNSTIDAAAEEIIKKRVSRRQNRSQKSQIVEDLKVSSDSELISSDNQVLDPEESAGENVEELIKKNNDNPIEDETVVPLEKESNLNEILAPQQIKETLDQPIKKKNNKKTKASKTQKTKKSIDIFEISPEEAEKSLLLKEIAGDLTGLEELENSIEKELNAEPEVKNISKQSKNKPKQTEPVVEKPSELLDGKTSEQSFQGNDNADLPMEDNNQELRRSRRGSRKIASYNENDLIDPLLDEIDGKKKIRKKEKAVIEELENKSQRKVKEPEKKLNSEELFDLLKASSTEKPQTAFGSNADDFSKELNDPTLQNALESILDSTDKSKEGKNVESIYEFTDSPENVEQPKDSISTLDVTRKQNKKVAKPAQSKSQAEGNLDSVSINDPIPDITTLVPSTPDILELSMESKTKSLKCDKAEPTDKSNYCEICNKKFIRTDNLVKHKRTLTHIQKLSEIEAKEAAQKSQPHEQSNNSSKTSTSIIEITSDSSKVTENLSKSDISIHDILQESDKPNRQEHVTDHTAFPNNHSLKLADIINDVLNKPVLEGDDKHNSFSDIIMQNNAEIQPEYRRYKSLGERKSFDSEPMNAEPRPVPMPEPYVSKTTILEKQISLLENIIENQTGVNYIDDISMSSNNSLENNVLISPSELSLKQDDSNTYSRINLTKPNTNDESFLKPSQYEEISEDSVNLRSYEDQKLRKTLNRDEELFLECCSLLKSGSEMSSYSNKKSQNKVLNTMGLKQCDEPEWLERKSLVEKPLYDVGNEYSDNSRIPTPLGDSYDDDASNSNTITSNWNINKKVNVFEDISQDKDDDANKSFSFQEILNEDEGKDKAKGNISKFGCILSKTIGVLPKVIKRTSTIPVDEPCGKKHEELSDGSTSEGKKIITKGARKVFEGLKVSIPTEELNLEEVLNCSLKSKKLDVASIQNLAEKSIEQSLSSAKPPRTARKSKPVKNKSQFGSNLLFKMKKKKVASPTSTKNKSDDVKAHDIYDFEETQDNTDVFTKPDFRAFRNMKSNEAVLEPESDTDSRDYLDSFSYEAQSITSSISSSSSKKPKTQENITKKKCMIMGRIFKNAAKSKIEDIDEEIRDIPALDNCELVESYVADCKKIIRNEEVVKPKLSEKEINQLFDQLLEDRLNGQDAKTTELKTCVKPKIDVTKKTDNKKKAKPKNKKRTRTNSDSTDDEFSLNKTSKKRAYRKNAKAEDNCINLEQELKECIGVASRKSQRKCTSGKQNVLVEYWSSDDSQFEALLETQRIEAKQPAKVAEANETVEPEPLPQEPEVTVESNPAPPDKLPDLNALEKHKLKSLEKKPHQKRKPSGEKKCTAPGAEKTSDSVMSNRRKRAAVNPLYHWSSSSEDESQDLIEVKPLREELEDDEDRPIQHGWIVGDSPKKLVTMLAQAKGKKTDIDCVKEQGKKRTNAVS